MNINNLPIEELSKDLKAKLDSLCQNVLEIPLKEVTKQQLVDLIQLEMNSSIDSLVVSCHCTRQIENFTPNSYSATETIDLKNSYRVISQAITEISDPIEALERYLGLKSMIYKLIAYKYTATEDFLRNLLRESEIKDGVKPVGRFNES